MSDESTTPRAFAIGLFLVLGFGMLLIATLLPVWTNQGWPKLALIGCALLAVAVFLIVRAYREPS
jgi:drug/metabolite transporter (DMT)-like permease